MDTWVWIAIMVAAAGVLVFVALAVAKRRRTTKLREGFGPEYDRTLAEAPSRREAEAELLERPKLHDELELRPVSRDTRGRYVREWEAAQARFVDEPDRAVGEADALIQEVMRERGYPVDDFEQRAADLSVDHGDVVDSYRAAHMISRRSVHGVAATDDLRQAMVHYRSLFDALLEAEPPRVESS